MSNIEQQDRQRELRSKSHLRRTLIIAFTVILSLGAIGAIVSSISFGPSTANESADSSVTQSVDEEEYESISEAERAALQASLSQLRNRIEALTSNTAKCQWQPEQSQQFVDEMERLVLDYASGQFQKVRLGIESLNNDLDEFDDAYQTAYESSHQQAQAFFEQSDMNNAELSNNTALSINPDHDPSLALRDRIEAYPRVKTLLTDLQRAEAERDIDEQARLIDEILSLDGARFEIRQKRQEVGVFIRDRDFSTAVANAYSALENGQLDSARRFATEGSAIDPSRAELKELQSRIKMAEQSAAENRLKQQITAAVMRDNWNEVLNLSDIGRQQFKTVAFFQEHSQLASRILNATNIIQVYIDQPGRLFDSNIRQVAQNDVAEFSPLIEHSASLRDMLLQTEQHLVLANKPIAVRFNSDGNTFIRVLRVGEVGKTKGRFVDLLPGIYDIEGRCQGYKTKIIPIEVLPQQDNEVTIVCDEKL